MTGSFFRRALAALVAVAIVVGLGWWWLSHRSASGAGQADDEVPKVVVAADGSVTLSAAQLHAQGVEMAPISAATQLPVPGLPAQAAAPLSASAQVVAPYAGIVTRILVDEGAAVRQGQALARIQSRDVLAAQGDLARARSEAATAALQAKRDAALLAEGIIPASRNEQSQARAAVAQSALNEAQGALSRLRPVNGAGAQAGEYELLSPMTGQVVRRHLLPGQAVAALDAAFVVAEPGLIDVNFTAPLRLRSALQPGMAVRLPDGATAHVTAIGADADPASQSLRVRARVAPGGTLYAPGQQFSVSLLLPVPEGAFAVPSAALLPAGQDQVLYVAHDPQDAAQVRIRAVTVRLLSADDGQSVVTAVKPGQLAAGAQVVTRGTALLKSMIPAQ